MFHHPGPNPGVAPCPALLKPDFCTAVQTSNSPERHFWGEKILIWGFLASGSPAGTIYSRIPPGTGHSLRGWFIPVLIWGDIPGGNNPLLGSLRCGAVVSGCPVFLAIASPPWPPQRAPGWGQSRVWLSGLSPRVIGAGREPWHHLPACSHLPKVHFFISNYRGDE